MKLALARQIYHFKCKNASNVISSRDISITEWCQTQ